MNFYKSEQCTKVSKTSNDSKPSDAEEHAGLISEVYEERRQKSWASEHRSTILSAITVANTFVFCISLIFMSLAYSKAFSRNGCLRDISNYSPMLEETSIPNVQIKVNGTLFDPIPPIIYRGDPSPEVDAAWEAISILRPISITSSTVRAMGKDPSITVRAPADWGYGTDAHVALLDGQHSLHCLNYVRKLAFYDHYFLPKYGRQLPPLHLAHRAHCLHILMQQLTCSPSTEVVTHNWMETQNNAYPDFNVNRKCRDHGAILRWQEEKWLNGRLLSTIEKPENAREVPVEPALGLLQEDDIPQLDMDDH